MKHLTAIAVIVDRPSAERARPAIVALGGAWDEMFTLWNAAGGPYLVLLAHTRKRVRLRAPLTFAVLSTDALVITMQAACSRLNNARCQWMLFLEAGSEGDKLVRDELLRDAKVEARA